MEGKKGARVTNFLISIAMGTGLFTMATSCNQIAGITQGAPHQCEDVSDCDGGVPECRQAVCEGGVCIFYDEVEGTPLASQSLHDCKVVVCDGRGGAQEIEALNDFFDDGLPCTLDKCNGISPEHVPLTTPVPCYTGPEGTLNVGLCRAGVQACDEGKPVGGCEEQFVPKEELCDLTGHDDDCNGLVNETGLGCICGDGYVSNWEACDDGNTADGDGCTPNCRHPAAPVAAGDHFTCAVLVDGTLKCWGKREAPGGYPGLGDWSGESPWRANNSPILPLGTGRTTIFVTASRGHYWDHHACALLDNGQLKCWGGVDSDGQLGIGSGSTGMHEMSWTNQLNALGDNLEPIDLGAGKNAISIAAGGGHTCALLDGGEVKCWGYNGFGSLGLGDKSARGAYPDQMGDDLAAVALGKDRFARALAGGPYHTCALLDDGSVKCWGKNEYGQLGLEDTENRGDEPDEMGDTLKAVQLGSERTAVAITAGGNQSCALLDDGTVKCWGDVAAWIPTGVGAAPGTMGDNLPVINLGKDIRAVAIAAGGSHSCAILAGGAMKCWGQNQAGQLGLGDTNPRGISQVEMGDNLPVVDVGAGNAVAALALGQTHTCVVLVGGGIKCWGENSAGQLGLGDALNRGDEPGEMGDSLPCVIP